MGIEKDIQNFNRFADHVEQNDRDLAKSFEEMIEMTDDRFAEYYKALMDTYGPLHGWWDDFVPRCVGCNEDVRSAKELRMYESRPYHPECLKKIVPISSMTGSTRRYWEKVLKISD